MNHPAQIHSSLAGDESFRELLHAFVTELALQRQLIQQHLQAGDLDALARKAHQLKGAGGGYGFAGLTVLAARVEEACLAKHAAPIEAAVHEMLEYIDRISMC